MSYCVNCGVELRDSERICPLCRTEVVNPREPFDTQAESAYPRQLDLLVRKSSRNITVLLISIFALIPCVICLLCDYIIHRELGWSLYVVCAVAAAWIFTVPLFYSIKRKTLLLVTFDAFVLAFALWLVETIAQPAARWFWQLALPIVAVCTILILAIILLVKHIRIAVLNVIAMTCCFSAILLIAIEIVTDLYRKGAWHLTWSFIAFVPLVLLGICFFLMERKREIKEAFKKKIHL